MPWSPAQIRLFRAAAHDPAIAASHGMSQTKAGEMASEGVKAPASPSTRRPSRAKALAVGLMKAG